MRANWMRTCSLFGFALWSSMNSESRARTCSSNSAGYALETRYGIMRAATMAIAAPSPLCARLAFATTSRE